MLSLLVSRRQRLLEFLSDLFAAAALPLADKRVEVLHRPTAEHDSTVPSANCCVNGTPLSHRRRVQTEGWILYAKRHVGLGVGLSLLGVFGRSAWYCVNGCCAMYRQGT